MSEGGNLYELAAKLVAQDVELQHAIDWLVESANRDVVALDGARKWASGALRNGVRAPGAVRTYVLLQEACNRASELRAAAHIGGSVRLRTLWRSVDATEFGTSLYEDLEGVRRIAGMKEADSRRRR